jgi:hypothetical protein
MPNHGGDQGGRPTLLTPDVIEPICAALRQGCAATLAAGHKGMRGYAFAVCG